MSKSKIYQPLVFHSNKYIRTKAGHRFPHNTNVSKERDLIIHVLRFSHFKNSLFTQPPLKKSIILQSFCGAALQKKKLKRKHEKKTRVREACADVYITKRARTLCTTLRDSNMKKKRLKNLKEKAKHMIVRFDDASVQMSEILPRALIGERGCGKWSGFSVYDHRKNVLKKCGCIGLKESKGVFHHRQIISSRNVRLIKLYHSRGKIRRRNLLRA